MPDGAASDDRIPLRFGTLADAGPDDAVLIDHAAEVPRGVVVMRFAVAPGAHRFGCACCTPRSAAATALGQLFQARSRGEVAWFTGVVAVVADPAALAVGLARDLLANARFRIIG